MWITLKTITIKVAQLILDGNTYNSFQLHLVLRWTRQARFNYWEVCLYLSQVLMYVIDHYYYNELRFISTSSVLQIHFHWSFYSFMILRYQIEKRYSENQSKLIREYEMIKVGSNPQSLSRMGGRLVEVKTQTWSVWNLPFHFFKLITIDIKLRQAYCNCVC